MQSYRSVFLVAILAFCLSIVTCLTIPSRSFAYSTEITKWKNNKLGAASLTFDDGYQAQYSIGVTALNEFGFKGTFFVFTDSVLNMPRYVSWNNWRNAASAGHEIGSHTETHPHLSSLSVFEMEIEILGSQAEIDSQITSQECLTFAYPYGEYNQVAKAIVTSSYIGARGVGQGLNSAPFDFYNAKVWFPESVAGSLSYQADLAELSGAWMIAGFHGMDGTEYGPVSEAEFRQFLNHISTKNLWVGTFGAVTRYIRERESANLKIVSISSDKMVLNLTDSLDDILYDEELTIRSEVPSNCVSALVAQGSKLETVTSVLEGSTKVIYFDAIPDRGQITVTFTAGPIVLSALSLSPTSVVGGFSTYGTVTLSGPAPSGGVAVTLSDNSTAVSVPASVTVPAGSSSATFEITTSAVNSSTSVSISAAYSGATKSAVITITSIPNNSLPIAVDDTYSTTKNTETNIVAPGVLSNDTGPENESLRAVIVSGPSHGILILNNNGSFSYTPTPNYIGRDSFAYMATDGIDRSNVATVTITVSSELPVSESGSSGAGGGGGRGCFITAAGQ